MTNKPQGASHIAITHCVRHRYVRDSVILRIPQVLDVLPERLSFSMWLEVTLHSI
jgi:hypothetical protein